MRKGLLLLCGLVLSAAVGCGSGPAFREVTGRVTWDEAPVSDGTITFMPEDKQFGAEQAKIKDGTYRVKVREGKQRVEVRAVRAVPGKFGPMGTEPLLEDYIPERYNKDSTLTADVAAGRTTFNFDLKPE